MRLRSKLSQLIHSGPTSCAALTMPRWKEARRRLPARPSIRKSLWFIVCPSWRSRCQTASVSYGPVPGHLSGSVSPHSRASDVQHPDHPTHGVAGGELILRLGDEAHPPAVFVADADPPYQHLAGSRVDRTAVRTLPHRDAMQLVTPASHFRAASLVDMVGEEKDVAGSLVESVGIEALVGLRASSRSRSRPLRGRRGRTSARSARPGGAADSMFLGPSSRKRQARPSHPGCAQTGRRLRG